MRYGRKHNTCKCRVLSSSPAQIRGLLGLGSPFRVYRERAVTTTLFIIYYLSYILYFVLGNDQLTMTFLSIFTLRGIYVLVVLFNVGNWQLGTGREVKVFLHHLRMFILCWSLSWEMRLAGVVVLVILLPMTCVCVY